MHAAGYPLFPLAENVPLSRRALVGGGVEAIVVFHEPVPGVLGDLKVLVYGLGCVSFCKHAEDFVFVFV